MSRRKKGERGPGRPPVPMYLRRINVTAKLPRWLHYWLQDQRESTQGRIIEEALRDKYGLEPPQGDDYLTTADTETGAAYLALDTLPAGAELLGTVTHPADRTGALVRLADGNHILYLAGDIRYLPPDIPLP